MEITVYTDGSALGNPGPGGCGIFMQTGKYHKEFSDGFRKTTNNRMELLSVIKALEVIKKPGANVTIYSDSSYVVNAVEKGWLANWQKKGFKKKKNVDLWKRFLEIYPKHNVKLVWVKGHAGNPLNERVDRLAVAAAEAKPSQVDQGYEDSLKNPDLFN
jgi:ribonuclease HI